MLARELSRELSLLVAAQPTRGVDVGSIEFIHKRIVETRDAGIPVIVVSTELDEVTRSPTASRDVPRARSSASCPATRPRDVLGLMMAGRSADARGSPRERADLTGGTLDHRPGSWPASGRRPPPDAVEVARHVPADHRSGNAIISVLAVVLALLVGGILIAFTDEDVQAAAGYFFARPGDTLVAVWNSVSGRVHRAVPGLDLQLRRPDFAARHPPAHRDARRSRRR